LLAEARTLADTAERKARYDAAQTILRRERPDMYLYYLPMPFAVHSRVQGFEAYPDGMIRLAGVKKN